VLAPDVVLFRSESQQERAQECSGAGAGTGAGLRVYSTSQLPAVVSDQRDHRVVLAPQRVQAINNKGGITKELTRSGRDP